MNNIPDDIMKTAHVVFLHPTTGPVTAIALAILTERERCANEADYYAKASLNCGYGEDATGAAYYACEAIASAIRNPEDPRPDPTSSIDDDDLPF